MWVWFLKRLDKAGVPHPRPVIILRIISLCRRFYFPRGEKEFLLPGQDGERYGVAEVEVDKSQLVESHLSRTSGLKN